MKSNSTKLPRYLFLGSPEDIYEDPEVFVGTLEEINNLINAEEIDIDEDSNSFRLFSEGLEEVEFYTETCLRLK